MRVSEEALPFVRVSEEGLPYVGSVRKVYHM